MQNFTKGISRDVLSILVDFTRPKHMAARSHLPCTTEKNLTRRCGFYCFYALSTLADFIRVKYMAARTHLSRANAKQ